jgi:hypothetical protein
MIDMMITGIHCKTRVQFAGFEMAALELRDKTLFLNSLDGNIVAYIRRKI